ncbi:hypothetical protein [uncultured Nocardioides sp.]|uniref:hypothetical protein n=1 Tax=uncultured Nocardioides sp. TaxID=198441 RepID=UPI0026379C75|nr:hypothetical protein [uncultured Nocardioides sp.]
MRRRLVVVVGGLVALALVAGAAVVAYRVVTAPEGDLVRAAEVSPASSQRLSFTDWAGVREEVGADVDADSPGSVVTRFLDDAFASDLTSTSAMVSSAAGLQDSFGLSPATVGWEGFSQSADGQVVALGVEDDDAEALAGTLDDLGYTAPSADDGVWDGGADLLARVDPTISAVFGYVVVLADQGLVLTSDSRGYLDTARDAALGDEPSMAEEVGDAVGAVSDGVAPLAAAVATAEWACVELGTSRTDPEAQATSERLVDAAVAEGGDVDPITAFAMAEMTGGGVRTALSFETEDQARDNADPRARLASGPATGQGGSFRTRFALDSVVADGRTVVLEMDPRPRQLLLSDLSSGPLLFATC